MRYWLMKSEPGECSIDDAAAAPKSTVPWVGVRNFQARNFMRDDMAVGDGVLFYHSSCPEPGVAGLAVVASKPSVDDTQFDPKSPYFDAKSRPEAPKWWHIDVKVLKKTPLLSLAASAMSGRRFVRARKASPRNSASRYSRTISAFFRGMRCRRAAGSAWTLAAARDAGP